MPANSTHQRRQYKRGNRVSSTTRAGRGRHAQGPASPVLGVRGKADCGTQAERMWSRGPAGSVTRRRFAAGGKVSRPAGRNPLEAETVGWKEDPSSVTAYAVTPSPLWGEGFSGGWKPPLRGPLRSLRRGAHCVPVVFHERPWSLRSGGSCPRPFSSKGCPKGVPPRRTEPLWDRDGGRETPHPSRHMP